MRWKQRYQQAKAQNEAMQAQIAELQQAAEELASGYEALEAEYTEYQQQAQASPSELEQQLRQLQGEILQRDARGAFDKAAAGKIRPDALEAAWKLAGVNVDSDDFDIDAITGLVDEVANAHPFLAQTAGEGQPDSAAKAATAPRVAPNQGPKGGQGAPAMAAGKTVVTRAQLGDPQFSYAHREMLANPDAYTIAE